MLASFFPSSVFLSTRFFHTRAYAVAVSEWEHGDTVEYDPEMARLRRESWVKKDKTLQYSSCVGSNPVEKKGWHAAAHIQCHFSLKRAAPEWSMRIEWSLGHKSKEGTLHSR